MKNISDLIKQKAFNLNFDFCGIAPVDELIEEHNYLISWLNKGFHGEMKYMENYTDIRKNPELLLPNAKSIIIVLINYFPKNKINASENFNISKYAYGKDYHIVIKSKLQLIVEFINELIPDSKSKIFCDTAPIFEKLWAVRSGLGWIGKNTCLIVPKAGSFFFIGGIITDAALDYDKPMTKNFCGNCTKCIDSCPNKAIIEPYRIDARKCISYLTIEYKNISEKISSELLNNSIFGCDICQDVCPINKKYAKPSNNDNFGVNPIIFEKTKEDWKNLTGSEFKKIFRDTPFERAGFKRLKRNIFSVEQ